MNNRKAYDKIISEELVRTTDRLLGHLDLEKSRQVLREFQDRQPNVVEFATSLGKELSKEGQNLLVYLAMVLWKIFDSAAAGAFPEVFAEDLDKFFETIEHFFLESKEQTEDGILNRFQEQFPIQQPFVYQYLLQELLHPDDDHASRPENELLLLFMALNSLLNLFSQKYEEL
ncbi:hypothetical protein BMS3Bbin03_02160 [bacterium BMS3Bbin03]|nr:hypothetical protein BMS3Bbin03_02160 [bacterium BMS3Bbin03]